MDARLSGGMSLRGVQASVQGQTQRQTLAPAQFRGLELLAKSLPDLRAEILAEISANPVLDDLDHPLEMAVSDYEDAHERDDAFDLADNPYERDAPETLTDVEEAQERRQRFLDNVPAPEETLHAHLTAQIATSEIPETDRELAEMIIGDINDDGRFEGSLPDLQMSYARTVDEIECIRRAILQFDPAGCGARDLRECLLAQMDKIPLSPAKPLVRRIITDHLAAIADGRVDEVIRTLGVSRADYEEAMALLRTLDPRPGRQFAGERERIEYVNPEVHAVLRDGWWVAQTDARSLPDIHIRESYLKLLEDPAVDAETKAYVRERIDSARILKEAVINRQSTLSRVATAIFDRQQDFFERGFAALTPMTELEIAGALGVTGPTVSRTVRGKYALTPFGTVELRKFFVSGVKTDDGTLASQSAAVEALKAIVAAENPESPLSDENLSRELKARHFPVARRTVAKYRTLAGIPDARTRRDAAKARVT